MADGGRVTYDEAIEDKQEETPEEEEHLEGFPNVADETDPEIDVETIEEAFEEVETISVSVPDSLKTDQEREVDETPTIPGRRGELPQVGSPDQITLDDLANLSQEGLLEIIARANVGMLLTLLDISDFLKPLNNITVTGTNIISNADNVQPVVPNSDQVDIPTREMYIKANKNNNDDIAFGDRQSDPQSGFLLGPGESITLPVDLRGETLYMSSETAGQEIELLGML